jgi:hypothetical protein
MVSNNINVKDVGNIRWKQDLRSKLVDGVLTALLLCLVTIVVALLARPIQELYGKPGMLVYTLAILALAIFHLDRSLVTRFPETTRAWFGVIGGLLAWTVTDFSAELGGFQVTSATSLLSAILLALVVATLWRKVLTLGVRFFALAYLLAWMGNLFLAGQNLLEQWLPPIPISASLTSYLAILAVMVTLWWLFFNTERRLERMWAAIWLWFFIAIIFLASYVSLI